ncbi:MAG: hypothetical protein VW683_13810 [Betaproteobacteria bacterium]
MASVAFVSSGTDSMALLNKILSDTSEDIEAIFVRFHHLFSPQEITYCEGKLDAQITWLKENIRDFTFTKEDQIAPSWSYYLKPTDRIYGTTITQAKLEQTEAAVRSYMTGLGLTLEMNPLKGRTDVYPHALERMYNYAMFAKRRGADKIYTGHDEAQATTTMWKVLMDNFWPSICSISWTPLSDFVSGSRLKIKSSIPSGLTEIINDCEQRWNRKVDCGWCRRCLTRRILRDATQTIDQLEVMYDEELQKQNFEKSSRKEVEALKELIQRI